MSRLVLDTASAQTFLEPDALRREQGRAQAFYRDLVEAPDPAGVKGWFPVRSRRFSSILSAEKALKSVKRRMFLCWWGSAAPTRRRGR